MGTKLQDTSYLSGIYTMRDLNENADGCQYHEDERSAENLYNGDHQPSNGYSGFDREMLKRTMLEQEALFKKQVYELHRIYGVQMKMMDEIKKGSGSHIPDETSQSNSCSSQIPSEGTSRLFQMVQLPDATTSHNSTPPVTDERKPTLSFLSEVNMQFAPVSVGKGNAVKDENLSGSSHDKGLPRRMFDLQLPADAYIDCDELDRVNKEAIAESSSINGVPLNRIHEAELETIEKLSLGISGGSNYRNENLKSDIPAQHGPFTQTLADLNEPAREIWFGKAAASTSSAYLGPNNYLTENQELQFPIIPNANSLGLSSTILKGRHHDEGSSANPMHVDDNNACQEWPFFNNGAGEKSSSTLKLFPHSSTGKFSMPWEQIQPDKKSDDILSVDQNKREPLKTEISRQHRQYGQTSASQPNSFLDASFNCSTAASPPSSSWSRPANGFPSPVPSLHSFFASITPNYGNPSDKRPFISELKPGFRVRADPNTYQNGYHGIQSNYSSASQFDANHAPFGKPSLKGSHDGRNGNFGPENSQLDVNLHQLLNGFQNGFTAPKINGSEGKCEELPGALSWLRGKPASDTSSSLMQLDYSKGYPQLKSASNVINPRHEKRKETERGATFFNLQDLPSSLQAKENTSKRNKISDMQSSGKLFGVSFFGKTKESAAVSPHQEQFQAVASKFIEKDMSKTPGSETQVTQCSSRNSKGQIDLNFDLNSSDPPAEDEMQMVLVQDSTIAREIDLEAPITMEKQMPDEAAANEAAKSILLISSDKCSQLDNVPSHPFPEESYNNLCWFAEMVSSHAESIKEISDTLDSFELMTLALKETKPDEFSHSSWKGQDLKDDNDDDDRKTNIASLLFTKPRRGQARKRRQRRDFQKDILPGLSSLSRTEVTEDLQTLTGLMKASGQSWQAGGGTRRNARNRTGARGRAGRRPRNVAVTVEEVHVSPLPPILDHLPVVEVPTNNTEGEVDGKNMIGWGRTTRRCRRQRFPPVTNVAAPLI